MHRMLALLLVAAVLTARPAAGQTPSRVALSDSIALARAQRLVTNGDGAAGRLVVDSVLARTPASSPRHAEALFWRASLATDALDAERDYRRIAVEYPLSPRVPDALTRLSQLELARGDRALAQQHLERLLREYPPPAARATAWYWLARVALDGGDASRGCMALDSARALAPGASAELANQIAYTSPRCLTRGAVPGHAAVADASAETTTTAPAAAPPPPDRPPAAASREALSEAFTVQVAAYPTRATADRMRARLAQRGYSARVVPGRGVYRVRVGRYESRTGAERAAVRLRAASFGAWIVTAEPRE